MVDYDRAGDCLKFVDVMLSYYVDAALSEFLQIQYWLSCWTAETRLSFDYTISILFEFIFLLTLHTFNIIY